MTIIEMFKNLRININSMSGYLGIRANTVSNKMAQGYDFTENEMALLREYLDIKVREMIKIMKKIDKILDNNE